MDKIHFSSNSDEWETPQAFFDELNEEFNFCMDLCSSPSNSKCEYGSEDIEATVISIGYSYEQEESYFMNPPYSRGLQYSCLREAHSLAQMGNDVVCLIPARTDTKLWHDFVWDEDEHKPYSSVELRLIKGRLKFEIEGEPVRDKNGRPQSAPFPSALVIFRGTY